MHLEQIVIRFSWVARCTVRLYWCKIKFTYWMLCVEYFYSLSYSKNVNKNNESQWFFLIKNELVSCKLLFHLYPRKFMKECLIFISIVKALFKNTRKLLWQWFICLELTAYPAFHHIRDKVLNNNLLINIHIPQINLLKKDIIKTRWYY